MARAPGRLSWTRKLAFGLLTTVLLLVGVEFGLRIRLGPPPAAIQVHSGLNTGEHLFTITDGWVSPAYQMDPIPAFSLVPTRDRVAFLGESSVHGGSWLPLAQEFPALVGELTGLEAINLGNPAIDSHDLVRIVGEISAWRWSAIVVYAGHNDFGNTWFQERYSSITGAGRARLYAWSSRSQLFAQLSRAVRGVSGTGGVGQGGGGRQGGAADRPGVDEARARVAAAGLKSNLERIAWICRKAGIPLVIVVPSVSVFQGPAARGCDRTPCAAELFEQGRNSLNQDPQRARQLLLAAWQYDTVPLRAPPMGIEVIRQVAQEGDGVWAVDALADLPQDPRIGMPEEALHIDVVHLSAAGHQAVAQLVAPVVQQVVARR